MFVSSKTILIFTFVLSLLFVNLDSLAAQTQNGSAPIYELPVGTRISVKMDNEINSKSSSVNDTFTVTISEPVAVRDVSVLPSGAVIQGRVLAVKSASGGGKGGILEVGFETLRLGDGQERSIEARLASKLKTKSSKTKSVLVAIGGAVIGAIIGGASKIESGVLIGSGVGGGAGIGAALLMKGKEARIAANSEFDIELTKKVVLPAEGF